MSVSILIISHEGVGNALLKVARGILGDVATKISVCEILHSDTCEAQLQSTRHSLAELNCDDGVLVLTDLFGATPSNIASRFCSHGVHVVSGMNLPMLLKALYASQLPLDALAKVVTERARQGILELKNEPAHVAQSPVRIATSPGRLGESCDRKGAPRYSGVKK